MKDKLENMISVIVPIYNGEKHIDNCIKSILNQTYQNIEVILIDDGSIDKSPQMCDNYKSIDKRVVVIHQKNSGVSKARNKGISISKGEYITFIDADDYFECSYLEKMYESLISENADIACGGHKEITINAHKNNELKEYTYGNKLMRTADEYFLEYCFNHAYFTWVVWGKLYRKNCLKGMQFSELKYGEDTLFMMQVLSKSPSMCFINNPGYCHTVWEGSVVNSSKNEGINSEYLSHMLEMKYRVYEIYKEAELSDDNKRKASYNYANEVYWWLMNNEKNSTYSTHCNLKNIYKRNISRAKQMGVSGVKIRLVFNIYSICAPGLWGVIRLINVFRK